MLADRRGQSTLEFVLIALVLTLLLFGGIALLNGFTNGVLTTNAARDGARIAAIDCGQSVSPGSDVYHAVHTDLQAGGNTSLTYVGSSSGSAAGDWGFHVELPQHLRDGSGLVQRTGPVPGRAEDSGHGPPRRIQ
jgi:hypothetical protein